MYVLYTTTTHSCWMLTGTFSWRDCVSTGVQWHKVIQTLQHLDHFSVLVNPKFTIDSHRIIAWSGHHSQWTQGLRIVISIHSTSTAFVSITASMTLFRVWFWVLSNPLRQSLTYYDGFFTYYIYDCKLYEKVTAWMRNSWNAITYKFMSSHKPLNLITSHILL